MLDALRQISFRYAADDDQFMTIAKLRAARQLWARVAEVVGEPDAGAARVHAVTSLPMMAQRDPWVNMLRTTLAAFSAGVGGADSVLVQPFDVAIPDGFPGTSASFARRMARNTQLLLLEESHIGRVLDPAGGSFFVEDLTRQLAEQAWEHFRDIESRGGFVEALEFDFVTSSIAGVAERPPTTSRTGAPGSPVSTSTPISRNPRYRGLLRLRRCGATRPGSRRCATAPTAISKEPGRDRRCCCCHWDRSPSTTSVRRSRSTCWRPAASGR